MGQQGAGRGPRPRIETLADLVFGLSLSIGALALIAESPLSTGELVSHIAAFLFSFLILITAWLVYTTYMSVLPHETRWLTFLNVCLLFLVALIPYLLNSTEIANPTLSEAASSEIRDFASSLFAVDLAGIMLLLAAFAQLIASEKDLGSPEAARLFRGGRNRLAILSVVLLASAAPVFWQLTLFGEPLRLYLWYAPLVSYWVGRAVSPDSRTYRVAS